MAKGGKSVTEANSDVDERRFERTIRQMLVTPPQPHEKAKGAAPKRDPRSSGKGSKR
jgi:hypothetical protein